MKSVNVHLGERYDVRFCADQEIGAYLINMTYDYACSLQPGSFTTPNIIPLITLTCFFLGNFIPPGFSPVPTCQFFGYLLYDGAEIPTNLNGTGVCVSLFMETNAFEILTPCTGRKITKGNYRD